MKDNKAIKNPFGNTIDMDTVEEETDNSNSNTVNRDDRFQEDFIKNELAKRE